MTTFDFATDTARAPSRPSVAVVVVNAIAATLRSWRNRRAFYRLGELSDHELRDIGLTRADLHVAVIGPLGADPTKRLRDMVDARAR